MKKILAGFLLVVLLVTFGCVQDSKPASTDTNSLDYLNTSDTNYGTVTVTDSNNPLGGLTHNVRIANLNFYPGEITINVGDTVSWRNEESLIHKVISRTGLFDSGGMGQGIMFSYKFTMPGTYEYYCSYHPSMVGKVIVK
jgi:plastocyanin